MKYDDDSHQKEDRLGVGSWGQSLSAGIVAPVVFI